MSTETAGRNLGRRLVVAAVGIPLCVAATWVGGLVFALSLGVLAAVGAWEYGRMIRLRVPGLGALPIVAAAFAFPPMLHYLDLTGGWLLAIVWVLAAGTLGMLRLSPEEQPITAAALAVFGALYIGGLLSFGVPLRGSFFPERSEGTLLFLLPVTVTWLADTAAFVVGRRFGRRKLAPRISPNKTVAGVVGAMASGPVVTLAYAWLLMPSMWQRLGPGLLVVLGLVIAGAAVLGDLVESALKRECGVKDASTLLPGHGGLMDRMDSLLWSIPVTYLVLRGWL